MSKEDQLRKKCISTCNKLEDKDTIPRDWLDAQLSIEAVMFSTDGNWLGAEILVSCGGPDIRVDTRWSIVEGYWGTDRVSISYKDKCGLDETLEMMCEI